MTPQERCQKAADLIRKYGWIKGTYGSYKTGFCILGALEHSSNNREWKEEYTSFRRAMKLVALAVHVDSSVTGLSKYNDKMGKEASIAALEAAAKL